MASSLLEKILRPSDAEAVVRAPCTWDRFLTWKVRRCRATGLHRRGGFCDVRFGGCNLARGSAEENADRERDDATDENEPGPRNLGPPIRHEPAEVPFGRHQLSLEKRS